VKSGRRTVAHPESYHYENIHQVDSSLVWSPGGRRLAFVDTIYDFDWGMSDNGEDTKASGNFRYFLAIVSRDRVAVGYRLPAQIDHPQIEWLDEARVKLTGTAGETPWERTFDPAVDPPIMIP
jgi:hypothetical protein